ncbi:MAG TPA: hypothetical protein VK738_00490 [Terriglobales bacterium]|nr:hypothetical protein [Terriglobales bacterium]
MLCFRIRIFGFVLAAVLICHCCVAQVQTLVAGEASAQFLSKDRASQSEPLLLAGLRPGLVWQRTSPDRAALDGPVLYQILFRSSAHIGSIPKIGPNYTLVDSGLALDNSGNLVIGGVNNPVFSVDNAGNVDVPAGAITISVPNNTVQGTTLNQPAGVLGNPAMAASSNLSFAGYIGIVIAGAGTSGNATIAQIGQAQCVFNNGITSGDYVALSGGQCHDAGSTRPPGTVIGRVLSASNPSPGTYQVVLFGPENYSEPTLAPTGSLVGGHIVNQITNLSAGTRVVNLTGGAAFVNSATYNCTARDVTTPANAVTITYPAFPGSGNTFTLNGVGSDFISFTCTGE